MSKMSKITIAAAVIAGAQLAKLLDDVDLAVDVRAQVADELENLAASLAGVMATVELVQEALPLITNYVKTIQVSDAVEGLAHVTNVVDDLVSDQEKILEIMTQQQSQDDVRLEKLLALLTALASEEE